MTGLTTAEVIKRQKQIGFNDIKEEKKNPLLKFLVYFWGPIPWMIETAAILSAVIMRWDDFAIILLLLIINAVVGFFQERKAENAIELLKKRIAPDARVLRDGVWKEIPSRELVPGDTIHIRLGNIVPADAILYTGNYLLCDESALTGESLRSKRSRAKPSTPVPSSARERWMLRSRQPGRTPISGRQPGCLKQNPQPLQGRGARARRARRHRDPLPALRVPQRAVCAAHAALLGLGVH